eukprot:COSAG06_NODE_842_length_11986_cov_54.409355_17_plen_82_part_01
MIVRAPAVRGAQRQRARQRVACETQLNSTLAGFCPEPVLANVSRGGGGGVLVVWNGIAKEEAIFAPGVIMHSGQTTPASATC